MKQETKDFMIWRAAESVGWDCTVKDLAAELEVTTQNIHEAVRRRGWAHRFPDYRAGSGSGGIHRQGVDSIMRHPHLQYRGHD